MRRLYVPILLAGKRLARLGARLAWRVRVKMHAQALGLTPAQQAGLTRLLLGSRPIQSFSAAELNAQSYRVEAFTSAAEVQAALDAAGQ